jgi:hypothetical protein
MALAVGDVDPAVVVAGECVRQVELAWSVPGSPREEQLAGGVNAWTRALPYPSEM